MKYTITITHDDETHRTELIADGTRYTFSEATIEKKREAVEDHEEMDRRGDGMVIRKPGPIIEFKLIGRILDEIEA